METPTEEPVGNAVSNNKDTEHEVSHPLTEEQKGLIAEITKFASDIHNIVQLGAADNFSAIRALGAENQKKLLLQFNADRAEGMLRKLDELFPGKTQNFSKLVEQANTAQRFIIEAFKPPSHTNHQSPGSNQPPPSSSPFHPNGFSFYPPGWSFYPGTQPPSRQPAREAPSHQPTRKEPPDELTAEEREKIIQARKAWENEIQQLIQESLIPELLSLQSLLEARSVLRNFLKNHLAEHAHSFPLWRRSDRENMDMDIGLLLMCVSFIMDSSRGESERKISVDAFFPDDVPLAAHFKKLLLADIEQNPTSSNPNFR